MHPLIASYIKLHELIDMNIRVVSPYYGIWCRMVDDERDFLRELLEFTCGRTYL